MGGVDVYSFANMANLYINFIQNEYLSKLSNHSGFKLALHFVPQLYPYNSIFCTCHCRFCHCRTSWNDVTSISYRPTHSIHQEKNKVTRSLRTYFPILVLLLLHVCVFLSLANIVITRAIWRAPTVHKSWGIARKSPFPNLLFASFVSQ